MAFLASAAQSHAQTRLWGTYYGGNSYDEPVDIAVYPNSGSVYIAGVTNSTNNIATAGVHQTTKGGFTDAFLVKFSSTGNRLWATYYGGIDIDYGRGVAVNPITGEVYLSGFTLSNQNIATVGTYQTSFNGGNFDNFLAKFDPNGTRIWGTYFGGTNND